MIGGVASAEGVVVVVGWVEEAGDAAGGGAMGLAGVAGGAGTKTGGAVVVVVGVMGGLTGRVVVAIGVVITVVVAVEVTAPGMLGIGRALIRSTKTVACVGLSGISLAAMEEDDFSSAAKTVAGRVWMRMPSRLSKLP